MIGGQCQVTCRIEKRVDRGRKSAAAAVTEDDNEPEAAPQVFRSIAKAPEDLIAESITGYSNDEQIVRPFIEDQFDRYACVRAPQHHGEGTLIRRAAIAFLHTKILRIHVNDPLCYAVPVYEVRKQRSKRSIALFKSKSGGLSVGWPRPE
jgi:hypothetical protein